MSIEVGSMVVEIGCLPRYRHCHHRKIPQQSANEIIFYSVVDLVKELPSQNQIRGLVEFEVASSSCKDWKVSFEELAQ